MDPASKADRNQPISGRSSGPPEPISERSPHRVSSAESARRPPKRYKYKQPMHGDSSHLSTSDNGNFSKRLTMPRTMMTARKEAPKRRSDSEEEDKRQKEMKRAPRKGRSASFCPICHRQFGQKSNMMRHLAVMHDKDEASTHLDETDKRRFVSYTTKATGTVRVTKRKEPKTPARVPHLTSSSSSSPERPGSLGQTPLPSAQGRPSSPLLVQVREDLALSSDIDSDEEYFVVVSEDESPEQPPKPATGGTAREPAASAGVASPPVIPPTEGRKPVRPRLPTVRSIRSTIEAPQPLPKMPQQEARKRRAVITTDRLAKAASENPSKSTQELADELTAEYSLTPEERRRCLHLLRGMRVAQRHLCGRIRRAFPMTNGAEEHQEFLGWLQTAMREIEGRDSDELP